MAATPQPGPGPNPGKDKGWAQMEDDERAAVVRLGWSAQSWELGEDGTPFETPWAELGAARQEAAGRLGYGSGDFGESRDEDSEGEEDETQEESSGEEADDADEAPAPEPAPEAEQLVEPELEPEAEPEPAKLKEFGQMEADEQEGRQRLTARVK